MCPSLYQKRTNEKSTCNECSVVRFFLFLKKKKKFNSWRFYSLLRVDFFFAREITFNFVVRVLCQISKFQHSHSVHVHTTKIPTYPRVGLTVRLIICPSSQSSSQPVSRSIVRLHPYLWVYFDSVRFASDWLGLTWFRCELGFAAAGLTVSARCLLSLRSYTLTICEE